jgi:hypothetical protein
MLGTGVPFIRGAQEQLSVISKVIANHNQINLSMVMLYNTRQITENEKPTSMACIQMESKISRGTAMARMETI